MRRFHIDASHAERVAQTALRLFDQVKDDWGLDAEREGKLLRWSALLHEIGMDISHSAYHKHGGYLVENLDMQGFSISEQYMLSLLVAVTSTQVSTEWRIRADIRRPVERTAPVGGGPKTESNRRRTCPKSSLK